LHPAGFEEITGIAAPDNSVGLTISDFALDGEAVDDNDDAGEDDDLLVDRYVPDDVTQKQGFPSQNGQMQWEQQ